MFIYHPIVIYLLLFTLFVLLTSHMANSIPECILFEIIKSQMQIGLTSWMLHPAKVKKVSWLKSWTGWGSAGKSLHLVKINVSFPIAEDRYGNNSSVYSAFRRKVFPRTVSPQENFGEGSSWPTMIEGVLVQFCVSSPGFIYWGHLFTWKTEGWNQ